MSDTAPPEACQQAIPEAMSEAMSSMDDKNTGVLSPEPAPASVVDTSTETLSAADPATPRTLLDPPNTAESSLLSPADIDGHAPARTALAPATDEREAKAIVLETLSIVPATSLHDAAAEPQLPLTSENANVPVTPADAAVASAGTALSHTVGHATSNLSPEIASPVQYSSLPTEDTTQLTTAGKHTAIIANEKAHAKSAIDGKPEATITEAKTSPKEKEPATERKPLQLLELPIDVLQLIFKEFGHSNDLAAIAKTCSTLYALAVPCLYASFDIVWSNSMSIESGGKSVDALTYGLSTICLGSSFARTMIRLRTSWFRHGPNQNRPPPPGTERALAQPHLSNNFTGNNYAEYTRKFSLGNGPSDDVGIYNVHRGRGKMLGTLASLSIAKMRNLEAFIWDMPTGVYSDVFMALASLPDFYPDTHECKLEQVWVRWHNNSNRFDDSPSASRSSTPEPPRPPGMGGPGIQLPVNFVMQGSTMTDVGIQIPPNNSYPPPDERLRYDESDVQFPTFSVLPPVKSLTVLDIDHISYLDELAILIYNSHARLEELRIGIAFHATGGYFVQSWDSPDLKQVDESACFYGHNQIGERRLGGVMGILVGHLFDLRQHMKTTKDKGKARTPEATADEATQAGVDTVAEASPGMDLPLESTDDNVEERMIADSRASDTMDVAAENDGRPAAGTTAVEAGQSPSLPLSENHTQALDQSDAGGTAETPTDVADAGKEAGCEQNVLNTRLKLTKLELERVPLSFFTMANALDWSTITSLTLLGCPSQEGFWRHLRKQFRPTPVVSMPPRPWWNPGPRKNYQLSLKSIHTDSVRKSLVLFVKETLRPNSLETLLLHRQHSLRAPLNVAIDDVFKNIVKTHHKSLRKLMINGDQRNYTEADDPDDPDEFNRNARDWDLPRDIITFITSGRMRGLRELSFSLSYSDWHPFLQMLPGLPNLTALHIQNISQHVNREYSLTDSAMQIADIVTLRMEMKLSYVATATKCFELIEVIKAADGSELYGPGERSRRGSVADSSSSGSETTDSDDDIHNDDDNNNDSDSDDEGDPVLLGIGRFGEGMGEESDASHMSPSDAEDEHTSLILRSSRVRLSEIFFFDDKVTIFKNRHGRL